MLEAQVGQHGHYVLAAGDSYAATVIEVTADEVRCKVQFKDTMRVVTFSRATGVHRLGAAWGRLVLREQREADNEKAS